MHAALFLLPLLAPVLGHTIPRHRVRPGLVDERALETSDKRGYPKAHFGLPPTKADLEGSAGFKRTLVRRRRSKRACKPKQSVLSAPSPSANSTIGGGLAVHPSSTSSIMPSSSGDITSTVITSSSAISSPSSSSSSAVPVTSASSSAAAPSASSGGGDSGLMHSLFPVGRGLASWTTSSDDASSMSVNSALNPLQAGHLPAAGTAPDGSAALVASYPAGTVKLASGQGFSFYTEGNQNGVSVTGAKEVLFSYSVFFQEGFQFVKGGKLPGLYGGASYDEAHSCSGGRQDDRNNCFSARLMWRANGMGEIYNYLPEANYDLAGYCDAPPMSVCDPNYGESIGRGAFTFPTGEWTTVAIRLKLNDYNVQNGEQELFVNGNSVIKLSGLLISMNSETKIYGIMAQTFFGGSDSSWASPQDQSAWFKDWSLAVLA